MASQDVEAITPPNDVRAEQSVLGALLMDTSAIDSVSDVLMADDFYRNDHRIIYEGIQSLSDRNVPADIISLADVLKGRGQLDAVGGFQYLNELVVNTTSTANIRQYARIIRKNSVFRRMAELADRIKQNSLSPLGKSLDDVLEEAEKGIFALSEGATRGRKGFRLFREVAKDVTSRLIDLSSKDQTFSGIATHYPNMDNVLAGLQRGDLIIVAGRPSMGKTTLAINIAENISFRSDLPVAIFSMEMSADQIVQRIISSQARIDAQVLRRGKLEDEHWRGFAKAVQRLENKEFWIDDTPSLRVSDLAGRARRLAAQTGGLGLIVIDYIQLMQGRGRSENRSTELSEISRGLKALAKELDCPVICLSQLNRGVDARPDKRPMMSDLRESGAIEQDADVIMFIYRDWVYHKESDPASAEVIVAKQRNGAIGTLRFVFKGGLTRFESWAGDTGYHEEIAEKTKKGE